LFVNNMADPDISDYEFDADDLLLMPSWKREILHVIYTTMHKNN
jgi:hypothetical protein